MLQLHWVVLSCFTQIVLGGVFTTITAFMLWMLAGDEVRSDTAPTLIIPIITALSVPLLSLLGLLFTVLAYKCFQSGHYYWLTLLPFIAFIIFSITFWFYFPR